MPKLSKAAIALCTLFTVPLAQAGEVQCKGNEAMLQRYLGMFDNVFNGRKMELIDEYTAPDFFSHDSAPGNPQGREAIRLLVTNMAKSFPKRHLTNDLIICGGDLVVAYQTVEGTNDGPLFGGLPPTGKSFNFKWIDIYRFKDDKVAERWGAGDALGMMQQMGFKLVPPQPAEAAK
ncbi:MAG: ester cyclase [Rhodospirillaceae bacterium]|nr:ester cyclase [Rhodospirillaceae bacterium]